MATSAAIHHAALEFLLVAARRECHSVKGRTLPVKRAFSVLVEHQIAGTQKEAAKMMEYFCTVGHAHIGSRGEGAKRQLVYEITTDPADSFPTPALNDAQLACWDVDFLETAPLELARQLTLHEMALFKAVNVNEEFPRIEEHDKPKSIQAWVDWNQKLTKWVVTTILVRRCEQVRIETVMHFIEIARECHRLNNFSTMSTIALALSSNDISRLAGMWIHIPRREQRHLEEICAICSVCSNFEKLRDAQDRASLPKIPFLPPVLKHISLIKIGNCDSDEDQAALMAPILSNVLKAQQSKYHLLSLERFQRWLRDSIYVIDDEERRQELSDEVLQKLRASTDKVKIRPRRRRKSSSAFRGLERKHRSWESHNRHQSVGNGFDADARSWSDESDSEESDPRRTPTPESDEAARALDAALPKIRVDRLPLHEIGLHDDGDEDDLHRTAPEPRRRVSTPVGSTSKLMRNRRRVSARPPLHRSSVTAPPQIDRSRSPNAESSDSKDTTALVAYLLSVSSHITKELPVSDMSPEQQREVRKLEAQIRSCVNTLQRSPSAKLVGKDDSNIGIDAKPLRSPESS